MIPSRSMSRLLQLTRRWFLAVLAAACLQPGLLAQAEKPYVVLVSIDGFRYDYAERYHTKNILPSTPFRPNLVNPSTPGAALGTRALSRSAFR